MLVYNLVQDGQSPLVEYPGAKPCQSLWQASDPYGRGGDRWTVLDDGFSQAAQGGKRSNEENFGARRVPDLECPFD